MGWIIREEKDRCQDSGEADVPRNRGGAGRMRCAGASVPGGVAPVEQGYWAYGLMRDPDGEGVVGVV